METSLAPGFLVAAPPLADPNFARSLVLLIAHNDEGALGIVINNEKAVGSVGELLEQLDLTKDRRVNPAPLRVGGPVAQEMGWIVFRPTGTEEQAGEIRLSEEVAVTPSREVLEAIAQDGGPSEYTIYLGHAGWAPGQLEQEVRVGAWLPVALDPKLVFDIAIEDRWEAAFERAGVDPAGFMSPQRGSS
jgi:putative transcriptional regulator